VKEEKGERQRGGEIDYKEGRIPPHYGKRIHWKEKKVRGRIRKKGRIDRGHNCVGEKKLGKSQGKKDIPWNSKGEVDGPVPGGNYLREPRGKRVH